MTTYIINSAIKTSTEHYEKYKDRKTEREPLDYESIKNVLEKIIQLSEEELTRASQISTLNENDITKIITSKNKSD